MRSKHSLKQVVNNPLRPYYSNSMTALPLIVFANWLTGRQLRRYFDVLQADFVAELFIAFALGMGVNGWIAVLLVGIGQLKPLPLVLLWLLTLLIPQFTAKHQRPSPAFIRSNIALLLWLPLACFLFFRPHQFVKGAADAGVYINIASNIAETGRLLIQDTPLETLHPDLYPALVREVPDGNVEKFLYLPGFYIEAVGTGSVTPQFYPLYPVWQAIAVLLGGVSEGLRMTGLWALAGTLAIFLLVRDLDRGVGRWLALTGLTLNAMQVWFARYPTTETLAQFTLWTGLWAFSRLFDQRDEDKRLFALLSALMFGSAMFTRIDLFPLALLPLLLLTLHAAQSQKITRQTRLAFLLPFVSLVVHVFAHAYSQSKPYFIGILGWEIVVQLSSPIMLIGLLCAAILFVAILFLVQRTQIDWLTIWGYMRVVVIVGVIGLAMWGWWIRPNAPIPSYLDWYSGQPRFIYDTQNLVRLGWYLGFSGVWLGILGGCWLLWRMKAPTILLLGTGIFFTLLYVWKLRATFAQIYAMRRYVPVTLPFLILCAALLLGWLITCKPVWQKAIGGILSLIWLVSLILLSRGFVTQINEVGSVEQVAALADTLDPRAILIFNDSRAVGDADTLGTPLRFLHQRGVFGLRDLTDFDPALFAEQIGRWQALGYTLYWVETGTADGYAWPLDPTQLEAAQPYRIELSALEETLEQKPTQILPFVWEGIIYTVK